MSGSTARLEPVVPVKAAVAGGPGLPITLAVPPVRVNCYLSRPLTASQELDGWRGHRFHCLWGGNRERRGAGHGGDGVESALAVEAGGRKIRAQKPAVRSHRYITVTIPSADANAGPALVPGPGDGHGHAPRDGQPPDPGPGSAHRRPDPLADHREYPPR